MPRGKWLACLVVLASTTPDVFPAAAEEEDDATPPGAAPGSSGPPAPDPLAWPEEDPVVAVTADVGYLPSSGSISATGEYRYSPTRRPPTPSNITSPRLNTRRGGTTPGSSWKRPCEKSSSITSRDRIRLSLIAAGFATG